MITHAPNNPLSSSPHIHGFPQLQQISRTAGRQFGSGTMLLLDGSIDGRGLTVSSTAWHWVPQSLSSHSFHLGRHHGGPLLLAVLSRCLWVWRSTGSAFSFFAFGLCQVKLYDSLLNTLCISCAYIPQNNCQVKPWDS